MPREYGTGTKGLSDQAAAAKCSKSCGFLVAAITLDPQIEINALRPSLRAIILAALAKLYEQKPKTDIDFTRFPLSDTSGCIEGQKKLFLLFAKEIYIFSIAEYANSQIVMMIYLDSSRLKK
jgi:hypothetical protein